MEKLLQEYSLELISKNQVDSYSVNILIGEYSSKRNISLSSKPSETSFNKQDKTYSIVDYLFASFFNSAFLQIFFIKNLF